MKKILLLIAMITLSVAATKAQVSFGIKAGLNGSTVSGLNNNSSTSGSVSTSNSTKIKLGGQFGIYANIHFGKVLGFQPEVLFSMKGYRYESKATIGANTSSTKTSVSLNYIEIPLQLRINPTQSFFILAGPYFGILVGASSTSVYTNGTITNTSKSSSTNGLQSIDFGVALGLGLKAENGFTMGLKYSRGFNSIYANDNNGANVNSVFQLFVGYEFGGKR